MRTRGILAVVLLCLAMPAAAKSLAPKPQPWTSTNSQNHMLVGKVFNAETRAEVSDDALINLLNAATILILGEIHDNADHHALQAWLARAFVDLRQEQGGARRRPGIVFEQLRADQQDVIDRFLSEGGSKQLKDFQDAVGWQKSGWQAYNYDPIFDLALANSIAIYAGDVPREAMMRVAKKGEATLSAEDRGRLKLDVPLGEANEAAARAAIDESHCHLMPKDALIPMAFAQRYRDAHLADATLTAAGKNGGAILITGNEHARRDRGVPWYIRHRAPDKTVLTVMLVEAEDEKTNPVDYIVKGADGKPVSDLVIFTPGAVHDDECAKMRAKMQR